MSVWLNSVTKAFEGSSRCRLATFLPVNQPCWFKLQMYCCVVEKKAQEKLKRKQEKSERKKDRQLAATGVVRTKRKGLRIRKGVRVKVGVVQ